MDPNSRLIFHLKQKSVLDDLLQNYNHWVNNEEMNELSLPYIFDDAIIEMYKLLNSAKCRFKLQKI